MTDLKTDRIPNGFILLGIFIGLAGSLWQGADPGRPVVSLFLAFLLLYPLFKIGALGAGDVKVFMMIGCFLGISGLMKVMASTFVIGAVCSLVKLVLEHNGRERVYYFLSYILEIARTRHWKIYGEHVKQDYEQYCRNKIHFTVPALFSVALRIGGMI